MKPQTPTFSLADHLLCHEQQQHFHSDNKVQTLNQNDNLSAHFEHLWDKDELLSLLSKQKNCYPILDGFLMGLRKESVDWIIRVCRHYGFVAMTVVLAVDYFDRFIFSSCFQRGVSMPWMNQLAAVACLSLASKVEEIQVPLLMGLQVEGAKFVFESKTIMRMELLVLDSLQWKMHPVTPLSFSDYVMRRLGLVTHCRCLEFVQTCEKTVLAVINDPRYLGYLPSVIAAAIMSLVIMEVDPDNAFDYLNELKDFLQISEEKVDDCVKFILEVSDNHGSSYFISQKRKYHSVPASPNGVIDSYFGSDNSNDSWAVASQSSVSSSPEPLLKKIRAAHDETGLTDLSMVSNFH